MNKKNSDAKIKANNRYKDKTYKELRAAAKIADYKTIENYIKKKGISKASFIVAACMDFIKRDELPDGVNAVQNGNSGDNNTDI